MESRFVDGKLVTPHGKSLAHSAILLAAAVERGCDCQPYEDWFTYKLWQEQGFQVQKGQHGVKLTKFVERTQVDKKTGKEKTVKIPWRYTVFCRCQVKEIE